MHRSGFHDLKCLAVFSVLSVAGHCAAGVDQKWVSLFNGKDLAGWKQYIGPDAKGVTPEHIWQIEDGVIRCAGTVPGYLLTDKEYANYELRFEWKWGEKPGNSGVFVHVVGPDMIWPKGIEGQLMADHAGDFWLVGGAKLTIDKARQDPGTERHYFRQKDGVEKPTGEWNLYEITCQGDRIRLSINGTLVNEGTESELTRGRILLQSEGAEIYFRNIELRSLDKK